MSTDPFDQVQSCAFWCPAYGVLPGEALVEHPQMCRENHIKYFIIPAMRRAVVEWLRDEGNKIVEQMKKLPRDSQGFIRLAFVAGVHTSLADQLERGGHG